MKDIQGKERNLQDLLANKNIQFRFINGNINGSANRLKNLLMI